MKLSSMRLTALLNSVNNKKTLKELIEIFS